jgi:hypothetical protein
MIFTKTLEILVVNKNIKYYKSKGYVCSLNDKLIEVENRNIETM